MALPKTLKYFNLFNDGNSYLGEVTEITLPRLERNMVEYRSGGMDTPIKSDQGGNALVMEWTCGGMMDGVLRQYGIQTHDGVGLRFAGSYQAADGSKPVAAEVSVRGRHSSIDPGTAKTGEHSEFKVTSELSYYKLTLDNDVIIEIDIINMIMIVDGTDLLADHRAAIGI